MSNLFSGSLCLTELNEQARKGHSAFSKANNGKIYFNIITWLNDEADKFGNTMSHQLSSTKEMRDVEGKVYIGNSKPLETNKPVSTNDIPNEKDFSEIPIRSKETKEAADDLPF